MFGDKLTRAHIWKIQSLALCGLFSGSKRIFLKQEGGGVFNKYRIRAQRKMRFYVRLLFGSEPTDVLNLKAEM